MLLHLLFKSHFSQTNAIILFFFHLTVTAFISINAVVTDNRGM